VLCTSHLARLQKDEFARTLPDTGGDAFKTVVIVIDNGDTH